VCGCSGGGGVPPIPMTSGDIAALGAGRPDRFAVVSKTETVTDEATGEVKALVLSRHPDYRLADLARKQTGGRIRMIQSQ
jgi:hypothetical protein